MSLTTRPEERPSWAPAIAPVLGAALIIVALLSLLSKPWRSEAEAAPVDQPSGSESAGPTSAGPTELGSGAYDGTTASRAPDLPVELHDSDGVAELPSRPPEITNAVALPTRAEGGSKAFSAPGASRAEPGTAGSKAARARAVANASSGVDLSPSDRPAVEKLCARIGAKLSSISERECLRYDLRSTSGSSVLGAPIVAVDYPATSSQNGAAGMGRVLLLGGIHGDEYSSVTIMFKWLAQLEAQTERPLHWRILPLLNPDGLLRSQSQRMNDRGVDLNRNFPTPNWEADATDYWVRRTSRNPRRYPGPSPLSEPESRFLHDEIARFKPDVIVAVHAPLEVVDFDGPNDPPDRLGSLYLRRMGTYPGSLGRYGGEHVGLPVVTIELPSAGTMPPRKEQLKVWNDLGDYLERTLRVEPAATAAAAASNI